MNAIKHSKMEDIALYPDSDKIGVWGMGIHKFFPQSGDVDSYNRE